MQSGLLPELLVRVRALPSSREEPVALTVAWLVHRHSAWTLDLADCEINEQAPLPLLELRAPPGLPSATAGAAALVPLSVASVSGCSFGCLLDSSRRPLPSALSGLSPLDFPSVSAHLLRPVSPPSSNLSLAWLDFHWNNFLHSMALF